MMRAGIERITVLLAAWLLLSPVAAWGDGLESLMARLSNGAVREALFVEERHAFYLDSPLKSQGRLMAIPPDRLEKNIVDPESVKQVIEGDRILHYRDGSLVREITLHKQPALAAGINALRAVLFGNIAYLRKTFGIHYEHHQQGWLLRLVPLQKDVAKRIRSIQVSGIDNQISEFRLTEANGDYSITRLYETSK